MIKKPISQFQVSISVKSEFIEERSYVQENKYFFSYTVTIENQGLQSIQLISRHWIINNAHNERFEVKGEGVVGEQPIIQPGGTFTFRKYGRYISYDNWRRSRIWCKNLWIWVKYAKDTALTSKYFSLILLFSILISCGKLNIQDSCNCESEKSALAEMEAELIELKKRQAASTKIPAKTFSEYSLLTKTKWEEIEDKLQKDQAN